MSEHQTDPFLEALGEANPVSEADFADLPPLGPLPQRSARRRGVLLATALTLTVATATGFALAPASAPGGGEVLERAFAQAAGGEPAILYWRVRTDEPGLGTFTDDVWMHVRPDGTIDAVRELRLDGAYAGMESVITQPHGVGDLRDAQTMSRSRANGPVKMGKGVGYPDLSFTSVIATAEKAARGELDLGRAREVSYEGRDAYEIRVREPSGPVAGERRNPSELGVTLWIDRETSKPLAVRWGEGAERWRTGHMLAFQRLPDDTSNRELLEMSRSDE
jgi:hypothetical protein